LQLNGNGDEGRNGRAAASQAEYEGSIPFTRSSPSLHLHGLLASGRTQQRDHSMNSDITRIGLGARMSEAVCYNGIVWVAGQVGNPGDSVADQTRTCLAEVDRILAAAGTDKTRILSAQIWLADIGTFADMNGVWDAWVPQGHTPARATGEAKLATPDYKVEVIVTAALK
jgi:enamine deaminase RidA (YjgF/YER057c/UK114 family)